MGVTKTGKTCGARCRQQISRLGQRQKKTHSPIRAMGHISVTPILFRVALRGCLSAMGLSGERLHPCGQTRNLAGNCVLVQNATRYTALQFRLCRAQSFAGGSGVARSNRNFNFFHECSDTANTRAIDQCAVCIADDPLFRRLMICHHMCPKFLNFQR